MLLSLCQFFSPDLYHIYIRSLKPIAGQLHCNSQVCASTLLFFIFNSEMRTITLRCYCFRIASIKTCPVESLSPNGQSIIGLLVPQNLKFNNSRHCHCRVEMDACWAESVCGGRQVIAKWPKPDTRTCLFGYAYSHRLNKHQPKFCRNDVVLVIVIALFFFFARCFFFQLKEKDVFEWMKWKCEIKGSKSNLCLIIFISFQNFFKYYVCATVLIIECGLTRFGARLKF